MDESSKSMPMRYVRKIFAELAGNYGTRFLNQWKTGQVLGDGSNAGEDAGVVNAMAVWARKLHGFTDRPAAIRAVLDNLPEEPPSLPTFYSLLTGAARRENMSVLKIAHRMTSEERDRAQEAADKLAEVWKNRGRVELKRKEA